MDLGSKIKEFGLSKFKTLGEFAEALDVKKESLSRYINNKVEPKASLFVKLAELGCDLTEMLTEDSSSNLKIRDKTEVYLLDKNIELKEPNENLTEDEKEEFQSALTLVNKLVATNQGILEENKTLINENIILARDYRLQSKSIEILHQKTLTMLEKITDILSDNMKK